MRGQNMMEDTFHLIHFIIYIENGAARVTKNGVDTLLAQTLKQYACAVEFHTGSSYL